MRGVPPRLERWRRPLARLNQWARPMALAGVLRQGAARLPALRQPSPLAIALMAAIALHLLALSAASLRQRQQPEPAPPPPRDDTPELLLFSRQQMREPAIAPLAIASLAQLPPPPPPLAPDADSVRPAAGGKPSKSVATTDLTRPRPHASQRTRPVAPSSPGTTTRRATRNPTRVDPALETALTALSRWQTAAPGKPPTAGEAGWPAPQKAEAEQLALWKRLWEKAAPAGAGTRPLPAGMELRRLTAGDSESAALPESQRLSLLLGDRLLLVWPAGRELWLLEAPATRPEPDGDPPGP